MLGEALRLIRVFHDCKTTELSKALDLSAGYISEIESGKKSPSMETLKKYADYFDTNVSAIMFFAEELDKDEEKSFKANALKHAGYILANEASHFEANALETATEIRAYSSEYFETNALKTIEGLHVDGVQTFKAKSLKTALEVILSDAISVDLRSLQKGYVQFEGNKVEQIILCHGSEDLMFSTVNLNDFIRQENEDGSITCINPDSLDPNAHLEIDDPSPF